MMTLEEARARILASLEPLPAVELDLVDALGLVPAEPLVAPTNLPSFDNSSVDGYAVRASDVSAASPEHPVELAVTGIVQAGSSPVSAPPSGSCLRIFTGAPLPAGSDAIVMQEDTLPSARGIAAIQIAEAVRPWENVRFAGEDLRSGASVLPLGEALRPAGVALLAAIGRDRVRVHRRPRLALFSTGNELQPPGEPLEPGRIYDSNRPLLATLAAIDGALAVLHDRVPDTDEASVAAFRKAASRSTGPGCDLVITTGGVSVGEADRMKPAWAAIGGSLEVWRVAMKPGKPFAWGRCGDLHWFGLPGNPVSAFVAWAQFVRPAIRQLLGMTQTTPQLVPGRLAEAVSNRSDRRHFLRVRLGPDGTIRLSGTQAAHIQSSLALANALLDVPPQTHWPVGHPVVAEWIG